LHFTGGSWNTVTPPPGSYTLKSVFMVSSSEGWAVGAQAGNIGVILHYTVTGGVASWGIFPAPASNGYGIPLRSLNSVFMLGPNEGWAVGDNATILHYTTTGGVGTWNTVAVSGAPGLFVDANLTSVFMLRPTSGWIVGGIPVGGQSAAGPVIIYWDGTHWTTVPTPTIPGGPLASPPILKSIYCTGANDCWAVGNVPSCATCVQLVATIFHWDGIAWVHITLAPSLLGLPIVPPTLNSVFMLSPSSGWIVGSPPLPPLLPPQELSTILHLTPSLAPSTSTTTVISTVTRSTSFLTGSIISTAASRTTSNTVIIPPPSSGNTVSIIVVIVVVLVVAIVLLRILIWRRQSRSPTVFYYPQRRR